MVKVAHTNAVAIAYMRTSSLHATKIVERVRMAVLLAIGGAAVRNHVQKDAVDRCVTRLLGNAYMAAI